MKNEYFKIEFDDIAKNNEMAENIKMLLIKYTNEFYPPLSSREGTTQTKELSTCDSVGIDNYYSQIINQHFIVAKKNEQIIGFISFIHDYSSEIIQNYSPANYITTVIVEKEYRRKGIASMLYKKLIMDTPSHLKMKNLVTRTWSTNNSHIELLKRLNFSELCILKKHRGNEIDTVYYGKFLP